MESQVVVCGINMNGFHLIYRTCQQGLAQVVEQHTLQSTLYRTSTKFGIETCLNQLIKVVVT